MENNIITVGGKSYDAHTGQLIESGEVSLPTQSQRLVDSVSAGTIHHTTQKSRTLQRKVAGKNRQSMPVKIQVTHIKTAGSKQTHERHHSISRFAPHPVVPIEQPAEEETADIAVQQHPLIDRVQERRAQAQPVALPPQTTKEQAIHTALTKTPEQPTTKSLKERFPRVFSMASGSLAILLLVGYLAYINMPAISLRVAAVQSGVDATYPSYQPSGYRLDGPITYTEGQVNMSFAANAGPQNYTITEESTLWDSSALVENHIAPVAGSEYTAHRQGGLTIYTYDGGAAWVNGGVLYMIRGDAPLSNQQILKIAGSL